MCTLTLNPITSVPSSGSEAIITMCVCVNAIHNTENVAVWVETGLLDPKKIPVGKPDRPCVCNRGLHKECSAYW